MFCQKCGKEIIGESSFCPKCGNALNGANNNSKSQNDYSDDYIKIREFVSEAKTIRNLGIWAAVLCFGIGIFFSIIIWIKAKNTIIPEITTTNANEIADFNDAKKKFDLGQRLAALPLIVIGIAIAVICIGVNL